MWALVGPVLPLLLGPAITRSLTFVDGTMWDHPGWACLRVSNASLRLQYPDDAEAHFAYVHTHLARWSQPSGHQPHEYKGYRGPWIENVWISDARQRYPYPFTQPLATTFGPFVPLLLNWVDVWLNDQDGDPWRYPPAFLRRLRQVLRPTVPYVTVSQNDEGITGKCELLMQEWPNILVLSAGGFGHVPIPLFLRPLPLRDAGAMALRKHLVSFVGSVDTAPHKFRHRVRDALSRQSVRLNISAVHYEGPDWMQVMLQSRVSLTPRGFGRSTFKVAETIHMGLIPLYVYSDVPWVPYQTLFEEFGYVTNLQGLSAVLRTLRDASAEALAQREGRVREARKLFLPEGIMDQVFRFLRADSSALQCVKLPPTVRDGDTPSTPC